MAWPTFIWGFVSIVQKQSDIELDTLTVRARDAKSLEEFAKRAGREGYVAEFNMATDYPFRDVFTRDEVKRAWLESLDEIRYSNFKNAAKEYRGAVYAGVLGRWWSASHGLTPAAVTKKMNARFRSMWTPSADDRRWAESVFAPASDDVRDADDFEELTDDEWAAMDEYLDGLEKSRGMKQGTLTHLDLSDEEWSEFQKTL